MRTINAQSNPLHFSVLAHKQPHEDPNVVGIHEQDDTDDGFLVTVTFGTGGSYGISLTEQELQTLGRCIHQRFGDQDPLIGQFFHAFENGKLDKQGRVAGVVESGYYLIEFFSWGDGEKNGSKVVQFRDMIDQDWTFYDDEEQWRSAGEGHAARQREAQASCENPFS